MNSFQWIDATSVEEAVALLADGCQRGTTSPKQAAWTCWI